jgi:hypothetical protein
MEMAYGLLKRGNQATKPETGKGPAAPDWSIGRNVVRACEPAKKYKGEEAAPPYPDPLRYLISSPALETLVPPLPPTRKHQTLHTSSSDHQPRAMAPKVAIVFVSNNKLPRHPTSPTNVWPMANSLPTQYSL